MLLISVLQKRARAVGKQDKGLHQSLPKAILNVHVQFGLFELPIKEKNGFRQTEKTFTL